MPREPGAWARTQLRTSLRATARERWREICTLVAIFVTAGVLIWITTASAFLRGLYVGALLATLICLLAVLLLLISGNLSRFWGIQAEKATAAEFTSRKRRGQGWAVVNGLVLQDEEIDPWLWAQPAFS